MNNTQYELNRRVINPITKEMIEDRYLVELLKSNNLNDIDFRKKMIDLVNYSINII